MWGCAVVMEFIIPVAPHSDTEMHRPHIPSFFDVRDGPVDERRVPILSNRRARGKNFPFGASHRNVALYRLTIQPIRCLQSLSYPTHHQAINECTWNAFVCAKDPSFRMFCFSAELTERLPQMALPRSHKRHTLPQYNLTCAKHPIDFHTYIPPSCRRTTLCAPEYFSRYRRGGV